MKYCFILGNNQTLSVAELLAVFSDDFTNMEEAGISPDGHVFFLEKKEKIEAKEIMHRLGGTIKIGKIETAAGREKNDITEKIVAIIEKHGAKDEKIKFGISYYGSKKLNIKPIGMEVKKILRDKGMNCRWVISRENVLSSVVVEQNKMVDKGVEIILSDPPFTPLKKGGMGGLNVNNKGITEEIIIGRTLAVQPFKSLSFRDYGRPGRDDHSGMLPPKLAQIMINLANIKKNEILFDPFCGSGTIITEAILMGCENLIGSDISQKAIEDTEKNITWIKEKYKTQNTKHKIFNADSSAPFKHIENNSIDAIVTEPYLGPQRGKVDIRKTTKELEELYSKALAEFYKILKPNGRAIMVFPVFRATGQTSITPNLNRFKIINPIPEKFLINKHMRLTDRNTIIYGREGQKVWREIVVLKK